MLSHESNEDPKPKIPLCNFTRIFKPICTYDVNPNILIALIKWVRKYSHHYFERYMCYEKLSQGYKSLLISLDNTHIPTNI